MSLILKLLTYYFVLVSFWQRKVFLKGLKASDLVLDIGSGDKPHWRADVIADKFLHDDQQRNSGRVLLDKRKLFVKADVAKLPFQDKTFDFVYCSHLLEHVDDPGQAIKEIIRVGKAGYLEVPSAGMDLFKPFISHLWFCHRRGNQLIFFQRESQSNFYTDVLTQFGQQYFLTPLWQYFFAKEFRSAFIGLFWQGKIDYQVVRNHRPYRYSSAIKKNRKVDKTFVYYQLFYKIMTLFFYRRKAIDKQTLF